MDLEQYVLLRKQGEFNELLQVRRRHRVMREESRMFSAKDCIRFIKLWGLSGLVAKGVQGSAAGAADTETHTHSHCGGRDVVAMRGSRGCRGEIKVLFQVGVCRVCGL